MDGENIAAGLARYPSADRIGFARLTTMAFEGADLRPLRDQLIGKLADGTAGAGEGLDLSLIAQLLGDKKTGMAMQAEVLAFHQLYRSPCSSQQPKLRVLALAAAIDMGGNTPIEFLLENSGIELQTLYVVAGVDLPMPLPEHDVAIVIASDSAECLEALRKIDAMAPRWPRPLLNAPGSVRNLDRDKLHGLLRGIDGIEIPATHGVARAELMAIAHLMLDYADIGVQTYIHVSWLSPQKVRRVTAVGSKKMAVYDDISADEKIRVYDKAAVPAEKNDGPLNSLITEPVEKLTENTRQQAHGRL